MLSARIAWSGVVIAVGFKQPAGKQSRCVDQSPSAAGGEDWVICARARWLATRVAWVSSAECQVAHGTGHGGTHMHWTGVDWARRRKSFFRIRPLFVTPGAETRPLSSIIV